MPPRQHDRGSGTGYRSPSMAGGRSRQGSTGSVTHPPYGDAAWRARAASGAPLTPHGGYNGEEAPEPLDGGETVASSAASLAPSPVSAASHGRAGPPHLHTAVSSAPGTAAGSTSTSPRYRMDAATGMLVALSIGPSMGSGEAGAQTGGGGMGGMGGGRPTGSPEAEMLAAAQQAAQAASYAGTAALLASMTAMRGGVAGGDGAPVIGGMLGGGVGLSHLPPHAHVAAQQQHVMMMAQAQQHQAVAHQQYLFAAQAAAQQQAQQQQMAQMQAMQLQAQHTLQMAHMAAAQYHEEQHTAMRRHHQPLPPQHPHAPPPRAEHVFPAGVEQPGQPASDSAGAPNIVGDA
jgi:hypothetical protein